MEDKYIMPEAGTPNSKDFEQAVNVQTKQENAVLSVTEKAVHSDQIDLLKAIDGKLDVITEMLQK